MDRPKDKSTRLRISRVLPYILGVLGLVWLLALILAGWNGLRQNDQVLGASVLAVSVPDYSGSRPTSEVQVIGLSILGDEIRDSDPQAGDFSTRLALITAALLTPVPTATPIPTLAIISSSTWTPTHEERLDPTFTVTATPLPTAILTLQASNTATSSQTVPSQTETPVPSPLPTVTLTATVVTPTPQPTATVVTPTPQPTNPHHRPPTKTPHPSHTPHYH